MPQYEPADLTVNAKLHSVKSGDIDKSAGVADLAFWVAPCKARIRAIWGIPTTEAYASNGGTISVGTAAASGYFGSVTLSSTAALGTATAGTILVQIVEAGTVLVADQTLAAGNGVACVQVDWTPED